MRRRMRVLIRTLLSVVLPLITVISLILAIEHWKTTSIAAQSLSTRYVGSFPSYLPELIKLVDGSSDTLLVASDLAGYGIYSDHGGYVSYQSALQRKVGLREFKMIVLNETGVRELIRAQFLGKDFDREIKRSKPFKEFVRWSPYHADQLRDMESLQRALGSIEEVTRRHDFRDKRIQCLRGVWSNADVSMDR